MGYVSIKTRAYTTVICTLVLIIVMQRWVQYTYPKKVNEVYPFLVGMLLAPIYRVVYVPPNLHIIKARNLIAISLMALYGIYLMNLITLFMIKFAQGVVVFRLCIYLWHGIFILAHGFFLGQALIGSMVILVNMFKFNRGLTFAVMFIWAWATIIGRLYWFACYYFTQIDYLPIIPVMVGATGVGALFINVNGMRSHLETADETVPPVHKIKHMWRNLIWLWILFIFWLDIGSLDQYVPVGDIFDFTMLPLSWAISSLVIYKRVGLGPMAILRATNLLPMLQEETIQTRYPLFDMTIIVLISIPYICSVHPGLYIADTLRRIKKLPIYAQYQTAGLVVAIISSSAMFYCAVPPNLAPEFLTPFNILILVVGASSLIADKWFNIY